MPVITSLESYWEMNEASGNATDAHGSNTLTDNNSVGTASGKVAGARSFTRSSFTDLSIADNASVSTGDIDFSFAGWFNLASLPASSQMRLINKYDAGDKECALLWYDNGSSDRFEFVISADGSTDSAFVDANNLGLPAVSTWYFIVCWHDSVNNQIGIQVNDGTADTTAHSGGVFNSGSSLRVGGDSSGNFYYDGLVDELGFWKKVLTAGEKTWLYNSGNGRSYADIVAENGRSTKNTRAFPLGLEIGMNRGGVL